MKSMNWSAVASIAASISALLSLVGIIMNAHYNKKNYKANLEIKSKLDLLQSIGILVPEYIASVDYALFLYIKASADDIKHRNTSFEEYSKQLNEAKAKYFNLKSNLSIYKANDLKEYVEKVWQILDTDKLNEIRANVTNRGLSKQEVDANNYMNKHSKELINCFDLWYDHEFNKLTK
ncbi:hypothetical protein [Lactobacillus helveticus]|uniref:hypothetical protein n=1 Tax=Lactobacillus helveticus TaxID=1587 RepID=UPI0015623F40|nr:hypothetical protein [Lactobacillus helveticus]NRN84096.1 hypothetical protein [Lactobacillus helveticus]NRN93943.1 hypothetical protein [Lactobacillus helveticus]NRN98884.1 hypothetical protein [Lactobacillus helveticus]